MAQMDKRGKCVFFVLEKLHLVVEVKIAWCMVQPDVQPDVHHVPYEKNAIAVGYVPELEYQWTHQVHPAANVAMLICRSTACLVLVFFKYQLLYYKLL